MSCCPGGLGVGAVQIRELQWNPQPNSITVPLADGVPAPTLTGAGNSKTVANVNGDLLQSLVRLGIGSSAAINSVAGARAGQAIIPAGNQAQIPGPYRIGKWRAVFDWGVSDPVLNAEAKGFVGLQNTTAAPAAVDPATLLTALGMGYNTGDANMSIYASGPAVGQVIGLGAAFPRPALGDVYRLVLSCGAEVVGAASQRFTWMAINCKTGAIATGSVENPSPAVGVTLAPRFWRATGPVDAAQVVIDMIWMNIKVQL
jgi:hypothetical protein